MLLPALLLGLVGVHIAIVVLQRPAQFPGPGRSERNLVGKRFWPGRVFKSVSLLLLVLAVCAGLGGLAQINPVWQYGPFKAANVTSPAQPDWYLGWVDGLVRLGGPWSFKVFGYTVSENFWPAILFPSIAFGVLTLWPWIERRFTGDRAERHLLDRPRDAPARTATGVAGLRPRIANCRKRSAWRFRHADPRPAVRRNPAARSSAASFLRVLHPPRGWRWSSRARTGR